VERQTLERTLSFPKNIPHICVFVWFDDDYDSDDEVEEEEEEDRERDNSRQRLDGYGDGTEGWLTVSGSLHWLYVTEL